MNPHPYYPSTRPSHNPYTSGHRRHHHQPHHPSPSGIGYTSPPPYNLPPNAYDYGQPSMVMAPNYMPEYTLPPNAQDHHRPTRSSRRRRSRH